MQHSKILFQKVKSMLPELWCQSWESMKGVGGEGTQLLKASPDLHFWHKYINAIF